MFTHLSRGGVPRRAILAGTVIGYASVVAAFVSPDLVFSFLVNSYGAVALFVYLMIALSQVALRKKLEAQDPSALSLKMWLFPWLSYATIGLMGAVIAAMAVLPTTRSQFWLSVVTLVFILIGYEFRRRSRAGAEPQGTVPAAEEASAPNPEAEQLVGVSAREQL